MNPDHLMNRPCTVTTAAPNATVDGMGDPTTTETDTASTCWLHQQSSGEITVNADTQIQTTVIWLRSTFAGQSIVRVTVGAEVYELDGPPNEARNARSNEISHLECAVKRSA